jgi:cell division protease FtsH
LSRFFRSALFPLIVIVLLVYLASQTLLPGRSSESKKITYSDLITLVDDRASSIDNVVFDPKSQAVNVEMTDQTKYKVNYPSDQAQFALQEDLQTHDVNFDSKGTGDSASSSSASGSSS